MGWEKGTSKKAKTRKNIADQRKAIKQRRVQTSERRIISGKACMCKRAQIKKSYTRIARESRREIVKISTFDTHKPSSPKQTPSKLMSLKIIVETNTEEASGRRGYDGRVGYCGSYNN
jgi:hypothetical protein